MTNMNNMKTKTLQVPCKFVGAIIGPKGSVVIGLAKASGRGCRIQHQRNMEGSFLISAWDWSTILRAEIKLGEHIKQLEKCPKKMKSSSQKVNGNGSRFSVLNSVEDTPHQSRHNNNVDSYNWNTNFKVTGTIKDRKKDKWLRHHATDEEKVSYFRRTGKSSSTKVVDTLPNAYDFPTLGESKPTLVVSSIWDNPSVEVRTDKIKTPTHDHTSDLKSLKEGEQHSVPKEIDYTPIKRVVEDLNKELQVTQGDEKAFSDKEEEEIPDQGEEEEWSDWEDDPSGFAWADEENW